MIKLYLDVDGVLNPITSKQRSKHWPDYKKYDIHFDDRNKLRIWLSKEMGKELWKLTEDFDLEIIWSTTWLDHANTHIAPIFGWPELRVLPYEPANDFEKWRDGCGKRNFVANDCGDDPVIWIDDYLGTHDQQWIINRIDIGNLPTLGIKPVESIGLSRDKIEYIRHWATEL